jgi:hypothetical protein
MIPWERDVYIGMINAWVKEENDRTNMQKIEREQRMHQLIGKSKKKR